MKHKSLCSMLLGAAVGISSLNYTYASDGKERNEMNRLVDKTISTSLVCMERSVEEIGDTLRYPTYGTKDLRWQTNGSGDWVSGFYPGCLWYSFALSNDKKFETWARQWTSGISQEKYNTKSHDLGFRFMCTFGNGLLWGDSSLKSSYTDNILTAAETLSKRYHPTFQALSSNWDKFPEPNSIPVVIDIMMNIELLFWASQNGGNERYYEMARSHALTTWKDFVRTDGGTYHVVRYDKKTGNIINRGQLQGEGTETTWSRGHAWMVYGLVVAYRFTHETVFLDRAKLALDYFIRNLPEDRIAAWDFHSKVNYRDVSASAIVVSALYELLTYLPEGVEKDHYSREADLMLTSLCKSPYFTEGKNTNCLLDHSVQYYPINSNVDVHVHLLIITFWRHCIVTSNFISNLLG